MQCNAAFKLLCRSFQSPEHCLSLVHLHLQLNRTITSSLNCNDRGELVIAADTFFYYKLCVYYDLCCVVYVSTQQFHLTSVLISMFTPLMEFFFLLLLLRTSTNSNIDHTQKHNSCPPSNNPPFLPNSIPIHIHHHHFLS